MQEGHALPEGLERRVEDDPLITGHGASVDDLRPAEGRPAPLHMAVVRSPYAHARVNGFDFAAARARPGVIAIYSGRELVQDGPTLPGMVWPGLQDMRRPERYPLAVDTVRSVGDPVAVVLAESRSIASDARDLVEVDYEPLLVVSDPEQALEPSAPLLYEELGSNVLYRVPVRGGDVEGIFARAEHTVHLRVLNQRLAPASLEPRACLFDYDETSGQFTAWVSTQSIFQARDTLAHAEWSGWHI